MLWLLLSLLAALAWSVTNIIDKHTISDEMRDPIVATTVAGFTFFLVFAAFSFSFDLFALPASAITLSFGAGVAYNLAIFFVYLAARDAEISRVIPIVKLDPLLILLGSLLLGEVLLPSAVLGAVLLATGAILIALKRPGRTGRRPFVYAFLAAAFYALRSLLLDTAVAGHGLFPVLAWVGLGGMAVGAVFLVVHHPHLRKKARKGIEHELIAANGLAALAFFLFAVALTLAPVSLVAAVVSLNIFFVFVIATALSKTHAHLIREEMRRSSLVAKLVAIALIFLGLILVV